MNGWTGKILNVNLTNGNLNIEDLNPSLAEKYIGGRGYASKIIFDQVPPKTNPLDPSNLLIIATGPLTGTGAIGGGRYMTVSKSPLTECISCANSGGFFGPEVKFAGYDMIVISGRSDSPVYLSIIDGNVEILSAKNIWGENTVHTESIIREYFESKYKLHRIHIASIGQAGEHLAKMAAVINSQRAAARSGIGAVMGSKNLKAIAVKGDGTVPIYDNLQFKHATKKFMDEIRENKRFPLEARKLYGTWRITQAMLKFGMLPTRNFLAGTIEGVSTIDEIREKILVEARSCFGCPFKCGRVTRIQGPNYFGEGEGPEHECYTQLGPCCGITDLDVITKANYLCNEFGLDCISAGVTIACAMELYENGYIKENDVPFPMHFGDKEALIKLIQMMAFRQGFGDLLAEGSYRLAEHFGHPEISMSVKKQEMPALHPQAYQGLGLAYATSNNGASHTRSNLLYDNMLNTTGEALRVKTGQDFIAAIDSAGACWSVYGGLALIVDELLLYLNVITGIDYTKEKTMLAGERIYNLERMFNLREGMTSIEDTLPKRMLEIPLLKGMAEGQVVRLHEMLPEYYKIRGWDTNGKPTQSKIEELGLD